MSSAKLCFISKKLFLEQEAEFGVNSLKDSIKNMVHFKQNFTICDERFFQFNPETLFKSEIKMKLKMMFIRRKKIVEKAKEKREIEKPPTKVQIFVLITT